jgi:hypothetical protein
MNVNVDLNGEKVTWPSPPFEPSLGVNGLYVFIKISTTIVLLDESKNKLGKKMAYALRGIMDISLSSDENYLAIHEDTESLYLEMSKYWTKILLDNGGKIGQSPVVVTPESVILPDGKTITERYKGIEEDGVNHLMELIMKLGDSESIFPNNKDMIRRCVVFSPLIWGVYVASLREDYMDRMLDIINNRLDIMSK